jgi:uncharacterized protein (UPF0147 family)
MDLKSLKDIPPWDWPEGAGATFLDLMRDGQAVESDRLLAAELAGDLTVINDELVDALLVVLRSGAESEELRVRAATSLGPILEQADTDGFEDAAAALITERTFSTLQESLREVFGDGAVPKEVRRRILEASVRAPRDWHQDAVRAAYGSGDEAWKLTAVFCMRFVRGFNEQILEALDSKDPDIRYEAVTAAGDWGVEAAWPHIAALIRAEGTAKPLLLAAIGAVAAIRPQDARGILGELTFSDDEDIAEAVDEALAMAEGPVDEDDEDNDLIH